MDNEKYKRYIIEMLQKIENSKYLERIYNYVHRFFVKEDRWKPVFLLCKNTFQIFFDDLSVIFV